MKKKVFCVILMALLFISFNVNGLRACKNKGFDEFFDSQDADFFAIQETI